MKSVFKMSKVMFLVVFLVVLSGNALGDNSSAESSVKSSNTVPIHDRSGPLPPRTPDLKQSSELQHKPVDAIGGKVDSKVSNSNSGSKTSDPSKLSCETEPCSQEDGKKSVSKLSSDSSSLNASRQTDSIIHVDPTGDLSRKLNPEALMRGFYVFVGLSVIVMVYIAWKSFGKRPTQVHRYGVVANREDLEMAPLDSDEGEADDEDTTHFDISKHRLVG